MKLVGGVLVALLPVALAACGVETAGTAATAAAVKKQEIEQGKNALRDAQVKIDAAAKKVEASAAASDSEK
jgi:curli biogenesis system outer membrane secretion channel CsgG